MAAPSILKQLREVYPDFEVRDATQPLEFTVSEEACNMGDPSSCTHCTWSLAVKGAMRKKGLGGRFETYTTPTYVYVADKKNKELVRFATSKPLREQIINVLDKDGIPTPGTYRMRPPGPSATLEGKSKWNASNKDRDRTNRKRRPSQKPRNASRFHLG